ncbi:MAG TPA: YbbC/YhhH family protein [Flavobacteriaceae bacterium]|nr:YbbC/YhhH family protein [Flavobacteriaceae bacterium]
MKLLSLFFILISTLSNLNVQESDRWIGSKEFAEKQLQLALSSNPDRDKFNFKLIPEKESAIKYAEILLFEQYGKENIENEKPYRVYLIDDYWVIFGGLPKNYVGGVFELVFDSWNGRVLRLSHGK